MRCAVVLAGSLLCVVGCDTESEPDLGIPKTKGITEIKQKTDTKMSRAELEEARRKAGFKDPEEQMAEAKAKYELMEKAFVKGRAPGYKKMTKGLRGYVDEIEKAAPKWAKAKDSDKAFGKFKETYDQDVKDFFKAYDELTEKGSRGGNLQVKVDAAVTAWENLNNDLGGKVAEAENFKTALADIRTKVDEIEKDVETIEKDESIEAEEAPEDKGGKKKKKG